MASEDLVCRVAPDKYPTVGGSVSARVAGGFVPSSVPTSARVTRADMSFGRASGETRPYPTNASRSTAPTFFVATCKGAAAARYADACSQAMEVARRLGGTL
jgi:hypothetical protein